MLTEEMVERMNKEYEYRRGFMDAVLVMSNTNLDLMMEVLDKTESPFEHAIMKFGGTDE